MVLLQELLECQTSPLDYQVLVNNLLSPLLKVLPFLSTRYEVVTSEDLFLLSQDFRLFLLLTQLFYEFEPANGRDHILEGCLNNVLIYEGHLFVFVHF